MLALRPTRGFEQSKDLRDPMRAGTLIQIIPMIPHSKHVVPYATYT